MENNTYILPTVAMRGIVLFPDMELNFDVIRNESVQAIETASANDSTIFLVTQHDPDKDKISENDLYEVGTIATVKQVMHLPGNLMRLIVKGEARGIVRKIEQLNPYIVCRVQSVDNVPCENTTTDKAYCRSLKKHAEAYLSVCPKFSAQQYMDIMAIDNLDKLCDTIAATADFDVDIKQKFLSELDIYRRAEEMIPELETLSEVMELQQNIALKTNRRIDESQREYFLREQLKVIRDTLGDDESSESEANEFRKRIAKAKMSRENIEKLEKEVKRFENMPPASPESNILRTYLDTVLDMPWNKKSKEKIDIKSAAAILDEDHYGLEKVKERILEFLAVRKMTGGKNTTVLCLEGPPGVGKTSVAKSIARALNRKYVRVSLGGIHDESDIRGHRKTYIGAMEGRIMAAMREAKVKNPLILLDEIDKMGSDYKGDPSAALLEVLDNEQNNEFRDHYIEIPFDLSEVLFITTANTLDTISQPLLDRMEIIRLEGYTANEKFHIARGYLVDKALKKTGMNEDMFTITDDAINKIIDNYTREAGVRKLEQTIEGLMRKAAKHILETSETKVNVTVDNLTDFLGKEKYHQDLMNEKNEVGVARGLAWTSCGGDTLSIEANVMDGSGEVKLTGKLGDVMKESAAAAISYIRSSVKNLNINPSFHKEKDIHIHVPEGAVPKDGPSAGITMATAVISSLTNRPVRRDIAMTGEITIRGRVLPIGGLKEKTMAAYGAGIRTIIIPEENKPDIDDVPDEIRSAMTFIPVSHMDSVIENALVAN